MTEHEGRQSVEVATVAGRDAVREHPRDSECDPKRTRASIPDVVIEEILFRSRRRCAMCYEFEGNITEVAGQIAHIDRDPSNADIDNLAFLCQLHHDKYDSDPKQTKKYLPAELKRWREHLYIRLGTSKHSLTLKLNYSDTNEAEVLKILSDLKRVKGIVVNQFNSFTGSHYAFLSCDDDNIRRLHDLLRRDPNALEGILPKNADLIVGDEDKAASLANLARENIPDQDGGDLSKAQRDKLIFDWDRVIDIYKSAISLAPRGAALWAGLGNAFVQKYRLMSNKPEGRVYLTRALSCLEKAIQYGEYADTKASDAAAWTSYSVVLFELEKYEEAECASNRAIQIDPRSSLSWENKIVLLANRERFEDALRVSEDALQALPASSQETIHRLVNHIQLELRDVYSRKKTLTD